MANNKFKANKGGAIALLVFAAIFLVGTIIFGVMTVRMGGEGVMVLAVLLAIFTVMFACFGVAQLLNTSKANANVEDPNSIAHATYGGGKDYARFTAYINRSGQAARNAAVNIAGAASAVLFGFGFFTWGGAPVYDVFVNGDELIINCYKKNPGLNANNFIYVPASQIADVDYRPAKSGIIVVIIPRGGNPIALEISVNASQTADRIRAEFSKLVAPTEPFAADSVDAAVASEETIPDTVATPEEAIGDAVAAPEETTASVESGESIE